MGRQLSGVIYLTSSGSDPAAIKRDLHAIRDLYDGLTLRNLAVVVLDQPLLVHSNGEDYVRQLQRVLDGDKETDADVCTIFAYNEAASRDAVVALLRKYIKYLG